MPQIPHTFADIWKRSRYASVRLVSAFTQRRRALQRGVKPRNFRKNRTLQEREFFMSMLRGSDYYHRRAGELRVAARDAHSSANRDTLLSFAADFDGLADEAESTEQAQPQKAAAC